MHCGSSVMARFCLEGVVMCPAQLKAVSQAKPSPFRLGQAGPLVTVLKRRHNTGGSSLGCQKSKGEGMLGRSRRREWTLFKVAA